jgi:uncharacterized membrane protein YjjP (DUF1212 family)/uncharacterized membrane protein YjjB (DUF3815 family)
LFERVDDMSKRSDHANRDDAADPDAQLEQPPSVEGDASPERTVDPRVLLDFMFSLAQAYLAGGEQTARIELLLRRIANAYGMRRTCVVAFPTAIFIRISDGTEDRVDLAQGPGHGLRLDQIAAVYTLGAEAERGAVEPADGLRRLNEIMRLPHRFGPIGTVAGHGILAAGIAMILVPTVSNLAAASVLGAIVGLLKLARSGAPVLAIPLPVIAAALTSALAVIAARNGVAIEPLHLLIPPLVTFLPGAMLAMAMVELAYGDMVSGASRLMTGFVQLVLLAFGLAAGALLVGATVELSPEQALILQPAWWAPWIGVMVFGIGVSLHFSAPKGALPWMIALMLVTFGTQQTAAHLVGSEVSGFWGTLVATPLAYLMHMRLGGPPAMVTFLPSFWILVPGALGLLSVKQMIVDRAGGIDGIVTVVFVLASIALGVLLGASLYRWLSETFGSWRTLLGRAAPIKRGEKRP